MSLLNAIDLFMIGFAMRAAMVILGRRKPSCVRCGYRDCNCIIRR